MDVKIDRDKCKAHGKCAAVAPDTFSLDGEGKVVLGDPRASPDEILVRAAKSCPYRVITVSSQERGQIFPPVKKPTE